MHIRTPLEIGLVIRGRRRKIKMSQAELARKIGVTRQWLIEIERGKPRAELGLVLRALTVLGVGLSIDNTDRSLQQPGNRTTPSNIDAIVENAKRQHT